MPSINPGLVVGPSVLVLLALPLLVIAIRDRAPSLIHWGIAGIVQAAGVALTLWWTRQPAPILAEALLALGAAALLVGGFRVVKDRRVRVALHAGIPVLAALLAVAAAAGAARDAVRTVAFGVAALLLLIGAGVSLLPKGRRSWNFLSAAGLLLLALWQAARVACPPLDPTPQWSIALAMLGQALAWVGLLVGHLERVRADLMSAKECYRLVTEATADIMVIYDQDGRVTFANPAAERLTGYRQEELIGRPILEAMTAESRPLGDARLQRRRDGDLSSWRYELTIHTRAGETLPVDVTSTPFVEDGRLAGCLIVGRDISERVAAEERMHRLLAAQIAVNRMAMAVGEEHDTPAIYQRVYEHVSDLMDADAYFVSAFDADTQRIRAAHAVVDGNVLDVATLPDIPLEPKGQGIQSEVIRTGQPLRVPDLRDSLASVRQHQVGDDGAVFEGPPRDDGADYARSALLVPMKVHGMTVGVMQVQSYRAGAGYTPDDADLLSSLASVAAIAVRNAQLYESARYEIAERQRAEEESRRLEAQLRQAHKMEAVGQLAGGVAHDFNNLLTVINGYSQLLIDELAEDDPLHADVEEIRRAGERAADLTRQLLAFSRRQMLEPRVLDPNVVLRGMAKLLGRVIGEDIRLDLHLDSGIGAVRADPGQIEQVVMNLALNARDAMPDGGTLIVETGNRTLDAEYVAGHLGAEPGEYVMLSVTDTGAGMPPDVREHVFEPFFTTKAIGRGTGLGLATVFGIVKQSGGNVYVYSEPGLGTSVKIYLPRVATTTPEPEARPNAGPQQAGHGECVLVVEDDPRVRRFAARTLRRLGYEVLAAPSGPDALRLLETDRHDVQLVLTDVVMPEMSGQEFADRVKATLGDRVPVLFMSGYSEAAVLRNGALREGAALVHKPFASADLAGQVRQALG